MAVRNGRLHNRRRMGLRKRLRSRAACSNRSGDSSADASKHRNQIRGVVTVDALVSSAWPSVCNLCRRSFPSSFSAPPQAKTVPRKSRKLSAVKTVLSRDDCFRRTSNEVGFTGQSAAAQAPPKITGRPAAADHLCEGSRIGQKRQCQSPEDAVFQKAFAGLLLKITTGLVASRPLRRRLRRWWCRCFFPLCHSKSLNGPSGMSRHDLYKIQRIIALKSDPKGRQAGEGNRTPVCSLGSCRSTIELHPRGDFRF